MHTLGVGASLKDEETDRGDGNSMEEGDEDEEGGIVEDKVDGVTVPTFPNPGEVKEGREFKIEEQPGRGGE